MKKHRIILATLILAMPLMAEETNKVNNASPETKPEEAAKVETGERKMPAPERRKEFEARHLQMMDNVLKEIGVTDEQRNQILVLQKTHITKMKANWKRLNAARHKLSELQDIGASDEEIDVAIVEVSAAGAEQLTILARNRKAMERILGKEKNDLLMERGKVLFREHGRRPGVGIPPRPDISSGSVGLPPTPPITPPITPGPPSP